MTWNFQYDLFQGVKNFIFLIKKIYIIYFGWLFAPQKTGYSPFANAHPLPSLRSVQWTASQGLLSLPQFKIKVCPCLVLKNFFSYQKFCLHEPRVLITFFFHIIIYFPLQSKLRKSIGFNSRSVPSFFLFCPRFFYLYHSFRFNFEFFNFKQWQGL